MDATPKPKPPVNKLVAIQPSAQESKPSVKKPYVRRDHLTQKPFRDDPKVEELRRELSKAAHPVNHKRR